MRTNRSVLSGVLRSTLTLAAAMAILFGATTSASAQTITAATYPATVNTGVALEDMTGSTALFANNGDDSVSGVVPIGFDFVLLGTPYKRFSVNANGVMSLGALTISNNFTSGNFVTEATATLRRPALAAVYSDGSFDLTTTARYRVVGTAPNRKLVVDFAGWLGGAATPINYQVWLHESTGQVSYVYGPGNGAWGAGNFATGISASTTVFYTRNWNASTDIYTGGAGFTANTAAIADGTQLLLTPVLPAAAPTVGLTSTTATSATINWTNNDPAAIGTWIYQSLDGVNFEPLGTVAIASTGVTIPGLANNTTYHWRVGHYREGGITFAPDVMTTTTAGTLTGTFSVGPTGTYATLNAAFTDLTTNGFAGHVILELEQGYTSAGEPVNGLQVPTNAGPNNTLTIRPQAGVATPVSISRTVIGTNGATLNFLGTSWVTVDGRPGGVGTSRMLIIENTSNSNTAGTAAIRFGTAAVTADSRFNTITYCHVRGSGLGAAGVTNGVIQMLGGGTFGVSDNTISNCLVGPSGAALPQVGIYSAGFISGLGTLINSRNTLSNNEVFDTFQDTIDRPSTGILVLAGNNWMVSNNKVYQTATRTHTAAHTGAIVNGGIRFVAGANATGWGNTVIGNVVGFANASGTGTMTFLAPTPRNNRYNALELSGVGEANVVGTAIPGQGNTVGNISLVTSSGFTTNGGVLSGINVGGRVTVENNTVGSITTPDSLVATSSTAAVVTGISGNNATVLNNVSISNNTIGGLTSLGSTAGTSMQVLGIQGSSSSATFRPALMDIDNNMIGSVAAPLVAGAAGTSTASNVAIGINVDGWTNGTRVSNNQISGLASNGTNTAGTVRGIQITDTGGEFNNNTISNLSTRSTSVGRTAAGSAIGLNYTNATRTFPYSGVVISGNTIRNIAQNAVTAATAHRTYGIMFNAETGSTGHTISRNLIEGLGTSTAGAGPLVAGIAVARNATVSSNIVRVGDSSDASTLAAEGTTRFVGLLDGNDALTPVTVANNWVNNTVQVAGTGATTGAASTAAYQRQAAPASGTSSLANNILANNRTNAGATGNHFSLLLNAPAPTAFASNFNNFHGTDPAYLAAGDGTTNFAALTGAGGWAVSSGFDGSSIDTAPGFLAATNLHIDCTSAASDAGTDPTSFGVSRDFDDEFFEVSGTAIGADEYYDLIDPLFTFCPSDTSVARDQVGGAIVNYSAATATDNCGLAGIGYSQNSGTLFPVGDTVVIATATDTSGNIETCTFTVTVTDLDDDGDGVTSYIENQAPNAGDGNNDSTPDRNQSNVVSLPNAANGDFATFVASAGTFASVWATNTIPGTPPAGVVFPVGIFTFTVNGLSVGGSTTVTGILQTADPSLARYYKFGPTSAPVWFNFTGAGSPGASILTPTTFELRLTDGGFGDADGAADGSILDPGGPAPIGANVNTWESF